MSKVKAMLTVQTFDASPLLGLVKHDALFGSSKACLVCLCCRAPTLLRRSVSCAIYMAPVMCIMMNMLVMKILVIIQRDGHHRKPKFSHFFSETDAGVIFERLQSLHGQDRRIRRNVSRSTPQ